MILASARTIVALVQRHRGLYTGTRTMSGVSDTGICGSYASSPPHTSSFTRAHILHAPMHSEACEHSVCTMHVFNLRASDNFGNVHSYSSYVRTTTTATTCSNETELNDLARRHKIASVVTELASYFRLIKCLSPDLRTSTNTDWFSHSLTYSLDRSIASIALAGLK